MTMKRKKLNPVQGTTYKNRNGFDYKCVEAHKDDAIMVSRNNWSFIARGCWIYEDGTIEWDYSTAGGFTNYTFDTDYSASEWKK